MEWQPIETAPIGTDILVWGRPDGDCEEFTVVAAYIQKSDMNLWAVQGLDIIEAEWWRPMIDAPPQ